MERDSSKHGPRLDEEMKREVDSITHGAPADSRVEEFRQGESVADGGPRPRPSAHGTGGSLRPDEVELRTDLARFLDRVFPATKAEVIENAKENGAPEHVIAWFARLPDRSYDGFPEIWEIGSGHDEPRAL